MPTIDEVIDVFNQRLLRNERKAASAMVKAYAESWKRIKAQLVKLDTEYAKAAEAGEDVRLNWYYKSVRAMQLQEQIVQELNKFSQYAGKTVLAEQAKAIRESSEFARDLIELSLGPPPPGVGIGFNKLPTKTIETMVGMNQPLSPLTRLLKKYAEKGYQDAQDALVQGIALGHNPRKIAPELRKALGVNLSKALTISRTEVMRAHRETSQAIYQANDDVVKGWRWSAALDATTCPSCFAKHGTEHPLSEKMASHPNCRCSSSPVSYTWEELGEKFGKDLSKADKAGPSTEEILKKYGIEGARAEQIKRRYTTGEAAFKKLEPADQIGILGKAKYQAWVDGDLKFDDLSKPTFSTDWGIGSKVPSLAELGLNKEKYEKEFALNLNHTIDTAVKLTMKENKATGGSTVNLLNGNLAGQNYCSVSIFPEKGVSFDGKEIDPQALRDYVSKNMDLLNRKNIGIGTWYNSSDGKTYIDIVALVADQDAARMLGARYNQIAIFNLKTFEEINTGGTGESMDKVPSVEKRLKDLINGN